MRVHAAFFIQVFQVDADDAASENFQAVHRHEAGAHPVADIGTGTDARVAVLDDAQDVMRIPHFIGRIVRAARMVVKAHADIEFLHEFFNRVHRVHGLGGDAVEV